MPGEFNDLIPLPNRAPRRQIGSDLVNADSLIKSSDNKLRLLGILGLAHLRQLQEDEASRSRPRDATEGNASLPQDTRHRSAEQFQGKPSSEVSRGSTGGELSDAPNFDTSSGIDAFSEVAADSSRQALIPPGILDSARPNLTAPDVNREDKRDKGDLTVRNRRGNFLPISVDGDGNLFIDPKTGVLGAILDAVTLPGDVFAGEVDPTSAKGLRRTVDLALTITPASMARARRSAVTRLRREIQRVESDGVTRRALARAGRLTAKAAARPITQFEALRSLIAPGP